MTENEKEVMVENLVTNGCCWKEEDRESLMELKDVTLEKLQANMEKVQQQEAVANAAVEGFQDQRGNKHVYNAEKGEWESVLVPIEKEAVVNKDGNEGGDGPQTTKEWLDEAPPEVQSAVQNAMHIEAEEKHKLAEQLTANLKDRDAAEKLRQRLEAKPLEDLRELAILAPKPVTPATNYAGAAGSVPGRGPKEDQFAPFGLPEEYADVE